MSDHGTNDSTLHQFFWALGSLKIQVLLENYYLPGDLEVRIG